MEIELSIIAAVAKNLVIGNGNELAWRDKDDMKRFRQLTLYHPIIMGRKTFDSLKNTPLPKRTNIVISKQEELLISSGIVYHAFSLEEAIHISSSFGSIANIIGGGEIYGQAINLAKRLEITEIHKELEGNVLFPDYRNGEWNEVKRDDRQGFSFVTYNRR